MSPRRPENPPLERNLLAENPMEQFAVWFREAEADVALEQAMTLATANADGAPDARMVLLKGFGPDGFRFFTNYESAKGTELDANPRAALVIYWRELDRQIRVRGNVERLSAADSDDYFASRPHDSRVASSISPQSRPIEREELERLYRERLEELGEDDPVRPGHWGGYLVRPDEIEFWQGRENRMHDRFLYTRKPGNEGWLVERLAP
ncbi:MAG TPA: pyridoxamine 5'-phosphate oxidase [Solirubrobacterales bacterium]|nr:pyridoxamine 5'-phosphate oxidase [Solirubrobacterales bacterium]